MKKREVVASFEVLDGFFDTELRIWKIPYRNKKKLKEFMANNNLSWNVSNKDKNLFRICCGDGLVVYVLLQKEYRKVGSYNLVMETGNGVFFKSIRDNISLKRFVSRLSKNVKSLQIYDSNGVGVSKSLWF